MVFVKMADPAYEICPMLASLPPTDPLKPDRYLGCRGAVRASRPQTRRTKRWRASPPVFRDVMFISGRGNARSAELCGASARCSQATRKLRGESRKAVRGLGGPPTGSSGAVPSRARARPRDPAAGKARECLGAETELADPAAVGMWPRAALGPRAAARRRFPAARAPPCDVRSLPFSGVRAVLRRGVLVLNGMV